VVFYIQPTVHLTDPMIYILRTDFFTVKKKGSLQGSLGNQNGYYITMKTHLLEP